MNADTAIDTTANTVASTSMTRMGAKAPRFTGSLQGASKRSPATERQAYGRLWRTRKPGRARTSPRRGEPHQGAHDPVGRVAPGGLVEVGEQLEDELHQRRPRQPVPGGRLHEPGVADEADEQAADGVIGAETALDRGAGGAQPGAVAALEHLERGLGGEAAG